jgi:hypothetical protein
MCDYSLMGLPNRLAREGENLAVHKFSSGSLGLGPPTVATHGFWAALKACFAEPTPMVVCVPPGARLLLRDIPRSIQAELGVGPEEEAVLIQKGQLENSYRDTIRFANAQEILFQRLSAGQRVQVLSLASAEPPDPVREEIAQYPAQPTIRW